MRSDEPPERHGPVEDNAWPSELAARVVSADARVTIQGYDVQGDLAVHYRFGEVLLLTLTGSLPDAERGRDFEVALIFASPVSIAEAPAHAASLARLCCARTSGVLGTGAIGLAEQARFIVEGHASLLDWLEGGQHPFPSACRAESRVEGDCVARLRAALGPVSRSLPVFGHEPSLMAAILGVMHACGLRHRDQLQVALCVARLGSVAAEALATPPTEFRTYPMGLPRFDYTEGEGT